MNEFLFCCCDKALTKSNLWKKSCILAYSSEGPESIMASMAVGTGNWKFTSSNINMKQRFQTLKSYPQWHTFSTPHQIASPAEDQVFKSWSLGGTFLMQTNTPVYILLKSKTKTKPKVGLAWGEGSIGKMSAAEAWGCPWHPQKEPSTVAWVYNITAEERAETGGGPLEVS